LIAGSDAGAFSAKQTGRVPGKGMSEDMGSLLSGIDRVL
jgi:hypothetical protein